MKRKWVLAAISTGLILAFLMASTLWIRRERETDYLERVPFLGQLVRESSAGCSVDDSDFPRTARFQENELADVIGYISVKKDCSAYHALIVLKREHAEAYKNVPVDVRAAVICSAMGELHSLNDFGILLPDGGGDLESGEAILELGRPALRFLLPLLRDRSEAPLFGSKEATTSVAYQYRRADFAYRYVMLILGRTPSFESDPAARDLRINALIKELGSNGG